MVSDAHPFQHAAALHECGDCGLFQSVDGLRPGQVAMCDRCGSVLRRRRQDSLTTVLALGVTGVALMIVAAFWPLMVFRLTGQERMTSILHLPVAFERQGMTFLAVVVAVTTLLAPGMRLGLTVAVLAGLRSRMKRQTLSMLARGRDWLKPWAMVEVFLLGLFVAFTRLEALAEVHVGAALYALVALMLVTAWADAWLDEHALWEAIGRHGEAAEVVRTGALIGCDTCGQVSRGSEGDACPRCEATLRRRKPQPLVRSWALMLTAAILYVPANVYPVLTVIRLGRGHPSTILGGVVELIENKMYPLAALVFVASVMVPLLKLLGLSTLLIMTQRRSTRRLLDRTRLFRLVDAIGRWSMIDVFMVALLTALVRMGLVGSVTPGDGAIFFALVVVLTMMAALCFDPRVMWDEAEAPEPASRAVLA